LVVVAGAEDGEAGDDAEDAVDGANVGFHGFCIFGGRV